MGQGRLGTFVLAFFLIGLGVLLLVFNLIPGWSARVSWPVIFFILAAGFFLPPVAFPMVRRGLAALFIPGAVLATLGLIFTYNVLSRDWNMWAYGWLLLSGGCGAGLALASWYGHWGRTATRTGIWILLACCALFAIFGLIFGSMLLKSLTAGLLILLGLLLLVRSFIKE